MRWLWLFVAGPWRLALAIRQNGLGSVAVFLVLNLRRHGLVGAMRMARNPRGGRTEGGAPALAGLEAADIAAASVLYLVRGRVGDKRGFARTQRCIRSTGKINVLEVEDGAAGVVLPPGPPDRFVVFLRAGDRPAPDLPRELARAAQPGVAEVVSFGLIRRESAKRVLVPTPGADPTCLRAADYLFGRVAVRGGVIAQVWDWAKVDPRVLVLDWLGAHPPMQTRGRWRHVSRPLVEAALTGGEFEFVMRRAIEHARRPPKPTRRRVSVIIGAMHPDVHLLKTAMAILDQSCDMIVDIAIVLQDAWDLKALKGYDHLANDPRMRVVQLAGDFNRARLANAGANAVGGDHFLFLHDRTAPGLGDWLERLLAWFDDPEVGVTSPRLRETHGAAATFELSSEPGRLKASAHDRSLESELPREGVGAVGAAMVVTRIAFEAVGGFDPGLPDALGELDLCRRLARSGFVVVLDPLAEVNVAAGDTPSSSDPTRLRQRAADERAHFDRRWGPERSDVALVV